MEDEPTLLKEYQREARARNIVRAEIKPQYGWQAAVREKMRSQNIDEENDEESDQKSFAKGAGGCHIK